MRFSPNLPGADLPKGVRDYLPLKAAKAEYLQEQLQKVYLSWGFRPVMAPQLEYLDVLERGLGNGLRERTFRFEDRQSDRLLAFPPDMTPQIARIAATRMSELPLPLRLCYHGRVLRHTEQQAGKDRDIFQSGVELIGLDSPEADAEMIAMAIEALAAVGAREFTIDIGQVEFFSGVMEGLPFQERQAAAVADAILRKDSPELNRLLEDTDLTDRAREEIIALPRLFGGREVLDRAAGKVHNDRSRKALESLERVLDVLEIYGVLDHVTIDLGELRGLNYHTGITFQGFLPGLGHAVCNGGRYNTLMEKYGRPAPATGLTFSLLQLLFALDQALDERVAPSCDLLIYATPDGLSTAQELARSLRNRGYSVARDMLKRSCDEARDYASRMSYRYLMVVAGPQEPLALHCLKTGQQQQLSPAEVVAEGFRLETAAD